MTPKCTPSSRFWGIGTQGPWGPGSDGYQPPRLSLTPVSPPGLAAHLCSPSLKKSILCSPTVFLPTLHSRRLPRHHFLNPLSAPIRMIPKLCPNDWFIHKSPMPRLFPLEQETHVLYLCEPQYLSTRKHACLQWIKLIGNINGPVIQLQAPLVDFHLLWHIQGTRTAITRL